MTVIKTVTRSHVVFEFDGKTGRIGGETFTPDSGEPDFVVYKSSFKNWEPPHAAEILDDELKNRALDDLVKAMMTERNMTMEVE